MRGGLAFGVVAIAAVVLCVAFLGGDGSEEPKRARSEPGVASPAGVGSESVPTVVSEPERELNAESAEGKAAENAEKTKRPEAPRGLAFEQRLAAAQGETTKLSLGAVVRDWRAGVLAVKDERLLDRAINAWSNDPSIAPELDKAVGQLLLAGPATPEQAQALTSLLANAGSELATGYLIEAVGDQKLSSVAASALASVSDPGVLPLFDREIKPSASPEILSAIGGALRNIDTPKARDLEARIDALRGN